MTKKVELMSPAGDIICLKAALDAGADSVYLGLTSKSMRSSAKNFEPEELGHAVELAHERNVKVCLTLNTIIYEHELKELEDAVKLSAEVGVDAIICSDFGVIECVLRHGVEPYVSTQISVSNSAAIASLYLRYGIRRFVLARECTLEEVNLIIRNLQNSLGAEAELIEIEVFVHGAMCVAVSGRCFMSAFMFNNSANRGNCRQPCRREYKITELRDNKSLLLGTDYVMSPNDICTIGCLEKILDSKVKSLKIEGRGRSPEYVFETTSCYRKFIDYYEKHHREPDFNKNLQELKKELSQRLNTVFHRGFSEGFMFGRPISSFSEGNGSKATHRKVYTGIVTNFFKKASVSEIKIESGSIQKGEKLMFQGNKTGVCNYVAESIEENFTETNQAFQGSVVGVKINGTVRKGDKVYRFLPVNNY